MREIPALGWRKREAASELILSFILSLRKVSAQPVLHRPTVEFNYVVLISRTDRQTIIVFDSYQKTF
jgi:hypothetical protein